MDFPKIEAPPGSVSADLTTAFLDHELQFEEFEYTYFLDFCSTMEACVLNEHVYNIDGKADPQRYLGNPFTKELYKEGAIGIVEMGPELDEYLLQHPATLRFMETNPSTFGYEDMDLWSDNFGNMVRASYFAVLEKESDIHYYPNFHSTSAFLYAENFLKEQWIANEVYSQLNEQYDSVKNNLQGLRKMLDGENYVYLPPIAYEILQKAERYEDIPEALLETRKKYTPLRNKFIELQELLLSPDITLKKKIKEKQKLFRAINLFNSGLEKEASFLMTSLAETANDAIKVGDLIEGTKAVKSIEWTKLIDIFIKQAEKLYLKLKLRPLYDTKNIYLHATAANIMRVVKRHYGRDLLADDFEAAKKYAAFTQKGVERALQIV